MYLHQSWVGVALSSGLVEYPGCVYLSYIEPQTVRNPGTGPDSNTGTRQPRGHAW